MSLIDPTIKSNKKPSELTVLTIKSNTKPPEKPKKLYDKKGLYLLLQPNGGKYWRYKYRYGGKERILALGVYPEVTLAKARDKRDEAKILLKNNIDPMAEKKKIKLSTIIALENNFESVATEWIERQSTRWTPKHKRKVSNALATYIFPVLGSSPLKNISSLELLAAVKKIELKGLHETANKVLQQCSKIFTYGLITGKCDRNPAADLRGALITPKTQSHAALSAADLPEFLQKLDAYEGHLQTKLALKLIILTFVRSSELRLAEWTEFKLESENPIWCIPASRMKMRSDHLVPLSTQAVSILQKAFSLSGRGKLLFPGQSVITKPISENTLLFALNRMGYKGRATPSTDFEPRLPLF